MCKVNGRTARGHRHWSDCEGRHADMEKMAEAIMILEEVQVLVKPGRLILLAFKDDKWWQSLALGIDALNNSDPFLTMALDLFWL